MKFISIEEIKYASNIFILYNNKVNLVNFDLFSSKKTIILLINFENTNISKKYYNNPNVLIRRFNWNIFRQKNYYRYLSDIESHNVLDETLDELINYNKKITSFISELYDDERIKNSLKKQILIRLKEKNEIKQICNKIATINPKIVFLNQKNINSKDFCLEGKNFNFLKKIKNLFYFLLYPIYAILNLKVIGNKELNYKLALRVYNAGLNFKNFSYKLDWIVKDKFINKKEVLLVLEDTIDINFLKSIEDKNYNYTFANKRKPYGKLRLSILYKNILFFFQSLIHFSNFFRAPIHFQQILLNLWMNYFVWINFLSAFKPKVYLAYHDYDHNHISRNILLNKINCSCLMYFHSCSEYVHDVKEKYLKTEFAYNCHDFELHWTRTSVQASRLNHSKSKKILLSSPLWASKNFDNEEEKNEINKLIPQNKKIIAVFPSGFINGQNNMENHISFLKFLKKLLTLRNDIFLIYKPKYSPDLSEDYPNFVLTLKELKKNDMFEIVTDLTSRNIIVASDLSISMPFSSTTLEAISSGEKSFFVDINNNFPNSAYKNIDKLVARSEKDALDFVEYWLTISEEKFANYLNNHVSKEIPLNLNNEAIDKISSIILAKIK